MKSKSRKVLILLIFTALVLTTVGLQAKNKSFYATWEVIDVTKKTILLRNVKGEVAQIDRSRRPYLKKGDRVRYDGVRNRLRRTIRDEK